jgi:uncharacterized membrane protein YkoI
MKRLFALAVLIAAAAAPAVAAPAHDASGPAPRIRVADGKTMPINQVLEILRAHNPGRHLNVSLGDAGGRTAYFVQWQFPDGRVTVFVVDAVTGRILGQQGR